MIAAGRAGELGKRVLLIEKNKTLGSKLKITGGGRCNITNNEPDLRKLLAQYGDAEQFLYSPFSQFGIQDTFNFFENRGLPLVTEARNRTFPKSQKAGDVCAVLIQYLEKNNVEIITDCAVTNVTVDNNTISQIITTKGNFVGKSVIIATGGLSHPETGSTGDGFNWLHKLGHTIHTPTPNIVPIKVADQWIKDLTGTKLTNIKITFFVDGKKKFSKEGDLLCTHFGLSGPLVLNSSKQVSDLLQEGLVTATIDCHPDKNLGELEKHIIEIFDNNKNKSLKNIIGELVPKGSGRVILSLLPTIDPDTKVNSLTKEARKELVRLIKTLPVGITGLMGFDRAVVADGGVDITEVDFKTMRSNKISNLFLTGDVLDIERPSGGFSLQLCWTTGYIAGNSV